MSTSLEPVSSTLLPEILGFHPQLLLDDIINAANDPIYQCTEFLSEFMVRWATERKQSSKKDQEDVSKEIEQGLVAFQTLLESHVDLAFDYFEVWTLRNIFTVPPDLPIVVSHQSGLDLHYEPQREMALFDEIEELRKKLQNRRRLNYLLKSALPVSRAQLARSRARFASVSFLPSRPVSPTVTKSLNTLIGALPNPIPPDPSFFLPSSSQLHDPSKQPWEQSKTSYDHWAVAQLVERTKGDDDVDRDPLVADAQSGVFGDSGEIWALSGATKSTVE
ncbi:Mis12 protein-domain-containing protein [Gautieria morchelliformis]|nr:Mis12 protein-domain-containing protein [Gautieria morchelliformis]